MAYVELFEQVAAHVHRLGVEVTLNRGKPLKKTTIQRAQIVSLIPIPDSMAEFYSEVGDGLAFYYCKEDGPRRNPMASYEFPKLDDVTLKSIEQINWRFEWDDSCEYRGTKDPTLGRETALRMRKWIEIGHEGNGDRFCLDTGAEGAPVVFDQHDWLDGGTGHNGHVMGDSLLAFFTAWSRVCFQLPRSLYWPSVFRPGGGVDWNSEEFDPQYRLSD